MVDSLASGLLTGVINVVMYDHSYVLQIVATPAYPAARVSVNGVSSAGAFRVEVRLTPLDAPPRRRDVSAHLARSSSLCHFPPRAHLADK